MKTYDAPGLGLGAQKTQTEQGWIRTSALLMVAGNQTDSNGEESTFSTGRLQEMAATATSLIESGKEIPFFEGQHSYENKLKIGFVTAPFWVAAITPETNPTTDASLNGKEALYGTVEIRSKDAIQRYQDGLIKAVSIGLDVAGEFHGVTDAIYELSAVPWGAVNGAAVFESAATKPKPKPKPKPCVYALTLDGQLAEDVAEPEDDEDEESYDPGLCALLEAFEDVTANIRTTTDEELQGRSRNSLLMRAVSDLTTKLNQHLNIAPPPVTPPPTTQMSKPDPVEPTTPNDEILERISRLEAENAALRQFNATTATFNKLCQRAEKLRGEGKLTPAAFADMFGKDAETRSSKIQTFAVTPLAEQDVTLRDIEAQLSYIEKYAKPQITFGSVLADEPITDIRTPEDEKIDSFLTQWAQRGNK